MSLKALSSLIDNATDEKQTEDDWAKILDVCEIGASNAKECLRLILKRMNHRNPHVVLRCIILLDACMQNIGDPFAKEISSRFFVNDIKSRAKNMHQKTLAKLCFMMKKWCREHEETEFDCVKELNKWLQETYPSVYMAGDDELYSKNTQKTNRKQNLAQEEEELAKAIALSLKEASQAKTSNSLYPNPSSATTVKLNDIPQDIKINKVRALYDFEAAEDNELSFKAGEIIVDVDSRDEHWWYGHNHRGEGMFPAQFVTKDLDKTDAINDKNSSKQLDSSQHPTHVQRPSTPVIDESRIDRCLKMLDDADPTGEMKPDSEELGSLEAQCRQMGPLIDQELEKVDRHYNNLVDVNRKIMSAFQMYNELMMTRAPHSVPPSLPWQTQNSLSSGLPQPSSTTATSGTMVNAGVTPVLTTSNIGAIHSSFMPQSQQGTTDLHSLPNFPPYPQVLPNMTTLTSVQQQPPYNPGYYNSPQPFSSIQGVPIQPSNQLPSNMQNQNFLPPNSVYQQQQHQLGNPNSTKQPENKQPDYFNSTNNSALDENQLSNREFYTTENLQNNGYSHQPALYSTQSNLNEAPQLPQQQFIPHSG